MKNKRWNSILMIGAILGASSLTNADDPTPIDDQVIVFVQSSGSELEKDFLENRLPDIREKAEKLHIPVSIVDVSQSGAPPEATITPLIVFQNHRGRSIFQGRYGEKEKIENFLRTSRSIPQGDTKMLREDLPVWKFGKARVGSPIKITDLDGAAPDFDQEAFKEKALPAIYSAFKNYSKAENETFDRADRLFYMDYYPFLLEDGTFMVSLALFSQFNCHEPVFTEYENPPYSDTLDGMETVFNEAARRMEEQVAYQLKENRLGDGFEAVDSDTRTVTWEELGFPIPPTPAGSNFDISNLTDLTLPIHWELDPTPVDGQPILLFRFPPPLDNYSGTAEKMNAELKLSEDKLPSNISGFFQVETNSLTMGGGALDETARGEVSASDFATSQFNLNQVQAPLNDPIAFGNTTQFVAGGDFEMKGKKIPVSVQSELTPIVNDAGEKRLLVKARFSIRLLENFGIEGPPGPDPQNDQIDFFLNFYMKEKAQEN